ncbi:MAG: hypothetical protein ACFCVK_19620 [Acidimicrobiales bacterium]
MAKTFIEVEMLPAGHGDALLVTYGDVDAPARMLIDGGPYYAYERIMRRLLQIPKADRHFELLVITHIDADHVDGVIRLLREDLNKLGFVFDDIWFNGTDQLDAIASADDALGAKQGEYLQALLKSKGLPWNVVFDGGPVLARPKKPVRLASGAKVRVLSPTKQRLTELLLDWTKVIESEGYRTGDTTEALARLATDRRLNALADELDHLGSDDHRVDATPDKSLANGSSIAFVLEVGSRRVLLAGDAHADVLTASIDGYITAPKKLTLQAFKLPHHGSLANLNTDLLDRLDCRNFLVSTNGSYFGHPDKMCIEMIVDNADDAHLWFNYATEFNGMWIDDRDEPYTAHYPMGITLR